MSGPEFFQTCMGTRFFEGTMPKIAEQLERLNDNLEALLAELRLRDGRFSPSSLPASERTSEPARLRRVMGGQDGLHHVWISGEQEAGSLWRPTLGQP
jgi:hypothetical protein